MILFDCDVITRDQRNQEALGREPDLRLKLVNRTYVHHVSRNPQGWKGAGCRVLALASAPSGGGGVFGFQTLFEAAEQNPVAFVLLVLPGMELPLDLEAPVHHEGRAQHREPVPGHMQLAGLEGGERRRREEEERGGGEGRDEVGGDGKMEEDILHGDVLRPE